MKLLIIAVTILTFVQFSSCERILFLAPLGSKSHKIFFMSIAEKLADRGHQVTMVTSYEPNKVRKNIKEVVVKSFNLDDLVKGAFISSSDVLKSIFLKLPANCATTLAEKPIQDIKKDKFDIIMMSMVSGECYLSFVDYFKVPLIYVSPASLLGPFSDMMGNIEFPSVVPNLLLETSPQLTFKDRLFSVMVTGMITSLYAYYVEPKTEYHCREMNLCPPSMESVEKYSRNASLVIINAVRSLEQPPRPMMPNVIYAGGSHIQSAKKLPEDLEEWIQGSGEAGFIYFSLGSALKPSLMPENHRKIVANVLGSLKQRVLWKWDQETMPDLPPNVKLSKWLPQQDILAHPKLKLFITHGGFSSTLESTYYGTPVLGMPVFADQFGNMKKVERDGWGKICYWDHLDEATFKNLILDIMNNDKMKSIAKERSSLMRDTPLPPGEEAVFWVEYVMRHKGAPHIKSPFTNMRWYKIYNMDVWATIIGSLLLLVYILWILLKFVIRFIGRIFMGKGKTKRD